MHKKYLKYYLLFIVLLLIPAAHNLLFLKRIGELHSAKEVAEIQSKNPDCLYASALKDNVFANKVAMYELQKPEVVAIGSSRILQIREQFFKSSFFNMGYVVSSVKDFKAVSELITKIHKPKTAIVSVDFWWFHKDYKFQGIEVEKALSAKNELKLNYAIEPSKWLFSTKVSVKDYFLIPYDLNRKICGIGAKGHLQNAGYDTDGSYYYTDIITSEKGDWVKADREFKDTKDRIKKGNRSFHHGSEYVEAYVDEFANDVKTLEEQGVKVVLFWPPLAPQINKLMKSEGYSYIPKVKAALKAKGLEIHDYTDVSKVSSDCEFVDGFHAGDVVYAKVLLDLAAKEPALKKVIDINYLEQAIDDYRGLAMIPDSNITTKPEVDFLGLGCKK